MSPPDAPREHVDNESVASYIRPLALVVFRREDGRILVAPGFDHVKQQRFYRPLGGGIEFGERAEDAARREILEELGAEIDGPTLLGTFENIFTYRGQQGHELIWLYEARFADASFYEREVVEADESGAKFEAHWVALDVFEMGDAPLYPEGLLDLLDEVLRAKERYHRNDMLIYVNLQVANISDPDQTETIRCLVDSGSIYSIIPAVTLERLGIRPHSEQVFQLANGETMKRRRGGALYRYGDRIGTSDVVFGEPGDAPVLGVFTLEALGLGLDPVRRQLIEIPMVLG
jgi:ADP-ribose pyrophosphatase YjhB (NUDIX family)